MRPEVDFANADHDQVARLFIDNGCVLLKGFCAVDALSELRSRLDAIHSEVNRVHLAPQDLREHGVSPPQDYLFRERHHMLLSRVFAGQRYRNMEGNVTRRIDAGQHPANGWQKPAGPYLDAFVHRLAFTVCFWVPLQPAGLTLPSLGVVCAPSDEVREFVGYRSMPRHMETGAATFNFGHFRPEMQQLMVNEPGLVAEMREHFGERIWTPSYELGDAMMLSNWTLHFTHATAWMGGQAENIEMRFCSDASAEDALGRLRTSLAEPGERGRRDEKRQSVIQRGRRV